MSTGTPLDLTPFGPVLQGLGILYWLLALAAAAFGYWLPKRLWAKLACGVVVLAAFVYPVVTHVQQKHQQHDEAKDKLDAAMALFQERCKSAGEKINRTVENVEGIVWMKWRPKEVNHSDQFQLNDPYGRDCYGDECIERLLRVTKGAELNPEGARQHITGYRFVKIVDPIDGRQYRYFGVIKSVATRTLGEIEQYKKNTSGRDPGPNVYGFALEREPIQRFTARYGVIWDDISTHEDREQWVAGGALRAIDLQTNEVLVERIGYLIDTGQGSTAGFRDPWGWAWSYGPRCPKVFERTWDFATRVLQPTKQGE